MSKIGRRKGGSFTHIICVFSPDHPPRSVIAAGSKTFPLLSHCLFRDLTRARPYRERPSLLRAGATADDLINAVTETKSQAATAMNLICLCPQFDDIVYITNNFFITACRLHVVSAQHSRSLPHMLRQLRNKMRFHLSAYF